MLELGVNLKRPERPFLNSEQKERAERFAQAMQEFRKVNHIAFATWSDAFWVMMQLGYTDGNRSTPAEVEPAAQAEGTRGEPGGPPSPE